MQSPYQQPPHRRERGQLSPTKTTDLRLFHALRMPAEGVPVTAVAHRCGWASASAFIDVFRRAYGYTPGVHHRRAARQEERMRMPADE
ncbi:AraC-like DNA-binding protein [Streptomyces candidus]|uniref:AraC-like DNA-binding protein n=1 Tax=Streptomyces candidus TaxID=67283 RepID=A0A7X0HK14_9ACTN|nr:AraC-like DNA-binding protein [Streptomyces candidus]GHH44247.1 hypothetical protein GCM10018773_31540 [Streptomyces candidus]